MSVEMNAKDLTSRLRDNATVPMVHNSYNNRPLNHVTVWPHCFVLDIGSFLPVRNLTV